MAILELVVTGSYYNQLIVNRWHYVATGTPAAVTRSFGLVAATGFLEATGNPLDFNPGTIAYEWRGNVVDAFQFKAAYARDLYSTTDFYERPYPTPVTGGNPGEGLSPAVAFGFYGSRVRTDIRRAMKRLVGVPESASSPGGVLSGPFVTAMTGLANLMDNTLTYDDEGNTITYAPVVLGLEEYTAPSGKRAYRPYATESAQLSHIAQGFTYAPYTTLRTQTSRQYGRGA